MECGRALRSTLFFILGAHSTAGAPLLETAWGCSWEIFPQSQRDRRVGLSKERRHDARFLIRQKVKRGFRQEDGGIYSRVMAGLPDGPVDDVLWPLASMNGGHVEDFKSLSNRRNALGDPAALPRVQDKPLNSRLALVADCAWISVGAVLGCLARLHTDRFTAAFGTYSSKVSNALGCFFLGLLVASNLDEKVLPHVYTGLTVGFCGSFTTYSGWNLSIIRTELPKFYPTTNLAGWLKGFSSMLFGALSSLSFFVACFVAGNDSAKALRLKGEGIIVETPNGNERESTGASWISSRTAAGLGFGGFCCMLGTLVLGHQVALYGVAPAAWLQLWKRDVVACLLSPLGALSRFFLSRSFNKRCFKGALPAGTFAANIIGSLAMGVTFYASIGNDVSNWNRVLLEGFKSGFLGGLTTMSTFAAEVVGHRGKHGLFASYGYSLLTVVSALLAVIVVCTVMH